MRESPCMATLPPLSQVRSFVAVVAHGRLNRAAVALGLTESAVSHHLRKLEHALGVQLLERGGAAVVLTPAGERFFPLARDAIARLEEAVGAVAGGEAGRVLLTLPRALATHWVVPRFPLLYGGGDEPELQLLPTSRRCDLDREQIDLGIRLGDGHWPGLEARLLLRERICPVATPAIAGEWRERGWAAMSATRPVIVNETHAAEWAAWCEATGRTPPTKTRSLESFDLVLQAGLSGSGLIMGRTPMVDDALARGDLAAPFPERVETGASWYVVWPQRRPPNRHATRVLEWLEACAKDSSSEGKS